MGNIHYVVRQRNDHLDIHLRIARLAYKWNTFDRLAHEIRSQYNACISDDIYDILLYQLAVSVSLAPEE